MYPEFHLGHLGKPTARDFWNSGKMWKNTMPNLQQVTTAGALARRFPVLGLAGCWCLSGIWVMAGSYLHRGLLCTICSETCSVLPCQEVYDSIIGYICTHSFWRNFCAGTNCHVFTLSRLLVPVPRNQRGHQQPNNIWHSTTCTTPSHQK